MGSNNEVTTETATTGGTSSTTETSTVSLSHDLSDHDGFKHKGHFHHPLESRYSETNSENLWRDTQGSISRGTSDNGAASKVSTQSITLEEFEEFYEGVGDGSYTINRLSTGKLAGNVGTGAPGGVSWTGTANSEYIFGGMWGDELMGGDGDDLMYGFEGDDTIVGEGGKDRLFGDAGNDTLWLGDI